MGLENEIHLSRLSKDKVENQRNALSLFDELPRRRLEIRFGKFSMVDFFDQNSVGSDTHFQFTNWEEGMMNLSVENIGDMAVVQCEGRIVQSEAAFKLREAVTLQGDARVVVLDLSESTRRRRRRSRHAHVSAAMGSRSQHSIQTIQSL
jgi:hypothetical protein